MRFAVIAKNEETNDRTVPGMLIGVVNVTVRVLDVNDNAPIIVVPSSTAANSSDDDIAAGLDVCAHARPGDRLLSITASDMDCGLNARLRYALLDEHAASSSSYFSMNGDDGWIVARQDLSQLAVGQTFSVTVVVTDGGRPPLSTNKTFLLTISESGCIAAAADRMDDGQVRGVGRFMAAVISVVAILLLIAILTAFVVLIKCGRLSRQRKKLNGDVYHGGRVAMERRWTEADGAEELTAKQRLNSGFGSDKTSTMCLRHAADDDGIYGCDDTRSCFNIQHEFEVVWQATSACDLQQVYTFFKTL